MKADARQDIHIKERIWGQPFTTKITIFHLERIPGWWRVWACLWWPGVMCGADSGRGLMTDGHVRTEAAQPGYTQLHPGHTALIRHSIASQITRSQSSVLFQYPWNVMNLAEITLRWATPVYSSPGSELRWPTHWWTLIIGCWDKWHNMNRLRSLAGDLSTFLGQPSFQYGSWRAKWSCWSRATMINISGPQAGVGTGAKERINKWPLEIKTVMDEGHSGHDSSREK